MSASGGKDGTRGGKDEQSVRKGLSAGKTALLLGAGAALLGSTLAAGAEARGRGGKHVRTLAPTPPTTTQWPTLDESYKTNPIYARVLNADNVGSFLPAPKIWTELGFASDSWQGYLNYLATNSINSGLVGKQTTVTQILDGLETAYEMAEQDAYVSYEWTLLRAAEVFRDTGGTKGPTPQPTTLAGTSVNLDQSGGIATFTLGGTTGPAALTTRVTAVPEGLVTLSMWQNKLTITPAKGASTVNTFSVPADTVFKFAVNPGSPAQLSIYALDIPRGSGQALVLAQFQFTGSITLGPDTANFHKQSGPAGRRLAEAARVKAAKEAEPERERWKMRDDSSAQQAVRDSKRGKGSKEKHGGKTRPGKKR